jgi:hypothetical protein
MANLYDLKKFDLNLLVIFECIYQHLSISKAAETLYITILCLSVPVKGSRPRPSASICIIIWNRT